MMAKLLLILFAAISAVSCRGIDHNGTTFATFHNPILDENAPDPYIFLHTDGYYYYSKTWQPSKTGVEVLRSRILTDWRNAERRVVFTVNAPFGNCWAPEIHYIRGNWYIYFAPDTN